MVVFQLICEELETVMELTEARVFHKKLPLSRQVDEVNDIGEAHLRRLHTKELIDLPPINWLCEDLKSQSIDFII
jgi:hypothetical protein